MPITGPPFDPLGGNTVTLYQESNGLLWAWGRDASILSKVLKVKLRSHTKGKTSTIFICFRYRSDVTELHAKLSELLPFNVALCR